MSILTTPIESPATTAARLITIGVQTTKSSLLGSLRHNVEILASYQGNKQDVLDALGTSASEVFSLTEYLIAFIRQLLLQANDTDGLNELLLITSKIPPYTKNNDGTVTFTVDN